MVVIYTISGFRKSDTPSPSLSLWRYARWGPGAQAGIATAAIFLSTYYAYALPTVSILLMAALMKGTVLLLAPMIDLAQGRRVKTSSAVALALSGAGVLAGCGRNGAWLPLGALGALTLYVGGYLVKLIILGRLKHKQEDFIEQPTRPTTLKTFVWSEQPWIAGIAVGTLALLALAHPDVARGWSLWGRVDLWVAGVLTQLTGIFSGFILTGQADQEHSYCVPLNRCAGVIAGLVATLLGGGLPRGTDLISAGCVVVAILFLSLWNPKK